MNHVIECRFGGKFRTMFTSNEFPVTALVLPRKRSSLSLIGHERQFAKDSKTLSVKNVCLSPPRVHPKVFDVTFRLKFRLSRYNINIPVVDQ